MQNQCALTPHCNIIISLTSTIPEYFIKDLTVQCVFNVWQRKRLTQSSLCET